MRRIQRIMSYNSHVHRLKHKIAVRTSNKIKLEELVKISALNHIISYDSVSIKEDASDNEVDF